MKWNENAIDKSDLRMSELMLIGRRDHINYLKSTGEYKYTSERSRLNEEIEEYAYEYACTMKTWKCDLYDYSKYNLNELMKIGRRDHSRYLQSIGKKLL